jgi:hypothetical protein
MSRGADLKKVSISDIKSRLGKPSLTSHYICNFQYPGGERGFIASRLGNDSPSKRYDNLSLACSAASLPGSTLTTLDIADDFHGVKEKHAYRRMYDDRADFTFYVDANEYYVIRFFEAWIGYCMNEQYGGENNEIIRSREYFYRASYPKDYYVDTLSITKFEKDYEVGESINSMLRPITKRNVNPNILQYDFINAFPISITSMPVSYESSQLLKCTVSFTYSRYIFRPIIKSNPTSTPNSGAPAIPELNLTEQAFNSGLNFSGITNQSQFDNLSSGFSSDGPGIPFSVNSAPRLF